jgi:hypothetical protein
MSIRKRNGAAVTLIVIASAGVMLAAKSPHFDLIRSVDLLQLVGSGACLGVAITLMFLKRSM